MLHVDPTLAALDAVPAAPPPPDRPGMARVLVERQLALLTRLADRGMQIAEAAANRAVAALEGDAASEAASGRDPSLTYEGAARAVRMTIALQARLLKDLPDLDKAEGAARADQRHGRRRRILHRVEQAVAAGCDDDPYLVRRLSDQAWSSLREADDYSDILTCPFDEAVARICAGLGLAPAAWVAQASAATTPDDGGASQSDPFCAAHPDNGGGPGSGRAAPHGGQRPRPPPWPG